MKWSIPAKTFLLGEYAALAEASAILLTTTPCFELSLSTQEEPSGIHPESPAGRWWQQQKCDAKGLCWHDPYAGIGGLGASSAQFLACYLATCSLQNKRPELQNMLTAYYQNSWTGKGLRPSGYDLIAQSQQACVYINRQHQTIQSYPWVFKDLSFFLIHTGAKLATHHHLQTTSLPVPIDYLSALADEGKEAFASSDAQKLITAVNDYHHQLAELSLVTEHSLHLMKQLKEHSEILAIKGCGALGADILLILTATHDAPSLHNKLKLQQWTVLATEKNLTNIDKTLEIIC